MTLNRSCIGKTYPPANAQVTLDALQQYARACNDDNPYYFDPSMPGGIVAPPMFNAVVTWIALLTAITDPELQADVLRLLHQAQDMEFFTPLRPGDMIAAAARINSIEDAPGGETMTIQLDAWNQVNAAVSRTYFSVIIRSRGRNRSPAPLLSMPAARANPMLTLTQTLDPDQPVRYAAASGDRNPIHLDERAARIAGLPRIIVHGLCTMAFTSKLMIDHLGGGFPERLQRLAVRFSRPVFPGDVITTSIWPEHDLTDRMTFSYETRNTGGLAVISDGRAAIRY